MKLPMNTARQKSVHASACRIALAVLFLALSGCGAGEQGDPVITTTATPMGATASLAWDPINDSSVFGYYIHYGKQSPGQAGSCAYENAKFVTTPNGSVRDLDMNSRYYFAVSAYNGVQSSCSSEVFTDT